MAIYHFHAKIIGRANGRSSVAKSAYTSGGVVSVRSVIGSAAYRAGDILEDERQNITHDFSEKSGVVYSDILLPDNAPKEFKDRETLWNAVEQKEIRRDAQLAREVEVSIPREFEFEEQINVVENFVKDNFVDKGMCADFSIHDKGDGNPHAHILLTVRDVGESGFENKVKSREWNRVSCLIEWRKEWAEECNLKFAEKGLETRIDYRSFEEQGIQRTPTVHIGHKAHALEKQGVRTKVGNINREIIKQNLTKIKNEYIDISREILNISEQRRENYSQTQEIKDKLESIDVYKKRIKQINEDIHELKTQEKQLGRFNFKRKKQITTEIQKCEQDKNNLLKDFKTKHKTDFYHADKLTAQLKSDLQTNNHNENFTDKANTLHKQKEAVKFEYQKIKLTADRHYFFKNGEIENALKTPKPSNTNQYLSNINEQLLINESERQLNHITAENTLKIAGQQKKLIPTPVLEIKRSLEIER